MRQDLGSMVDFATLGARKARQEVRVTGADLMKLRTLADVAAGAQLAAEAAAEVSKDAKAAAAAQRIADERDAFLQKAFTAWCIGNGLDMTLDWNLELETGRVRLKAGG